MRIARYVVDDEPVFGTVELSEDRGDYPQTVSTLSGDPMVGPVRYTGDRRDLADVRLIAPVIPRSKVVCFGDTYGTEEDLASRRGRPLDVPIFLKPNTSVIGPGEPIVLPSESDNVWFEGELAIVIGKICRRVPIEMAEKVVFGYTIGNDITAKDLQVPGRPWTLAKGYDSFCPLGPWIVMHWGQKDVTNSTLRSWVNAEPRQDSSLSMLAPSVAELVSEASKFATLLPGDVILTGAAPGPGPIVSGDRVSVSIAGIGELSNPVFSEEA